MERMRKTANFNESVKTRGGQISGEPRKKNGGKKKNQDGGRFKQKKPNADDIPGYDFKEVNISSVRQCEHDGFPAYRLLINICTSVCTVIGLKMTGASTETHRLTCLKNAFLC